MHEPGRAFDQDVLEMTATARHARQGAVTVAARQAMTMAGPCEPGDVLGVVVRATSSSSARTSTRSPPTCSTGCSAAAASWSRSSPAPTTPTVPWPTRCAAYVEEHHPAVDVVVYDGGQERYPLLLSVE